MKKILKLFAFIFVFIIMGLSYLLYKSILINQNKPLKQFQKLPPTNNSQNDQLSKMKTIIFGDTKYRYFYQEIFVDKNISLNSNFVKKESAQDLRDKYACNILSNAGFYDKNDNPLGWYVIEGKKLHNSINSRLFDGYVFQSSKNIQINLETPTKDVKWGFQTGPVLFWQNQPTQIKIVDDKYSRRMILFKTQGGNIYLLTLVTDDLLSSGPYLGDLPQILVNISQQENWHISKAINLDGGRASALISDQIQIYELTWIGSFLCVK